MSDSKITAIVLAGGQGKRMHSSLPKVLHTAAGRTLLDYVVSSVRSAGVQEVRVVVGHGADEVKKSISGVAFHHQAKQLGTADAVRSADLESLKGTVVICNGDMPFVQKEDIEKLVAFFRAKKCDLVVAGSRVKNPKGLGRLVHKTGVLSKIVEQRDATEAELKIRDINVGIYVLSSENLKKYISKISNQNNQKEFYLTDIVSLMNQDKKDVRTFLNLSPQVSRGVNDQFELSYVRKFMFLQKAKELCASGVVVEDPWQTYIDQNCSVGTGTVIGPGVKMTGQTQVGKDCVIEGHCQLVKAKIADGVQVKWGSVIEESQVGKNARLGPYARLRPESNVGEDCHIGNFVELKKANLARGVKANHLTYLGDVEIGEGTNIGCGTITCNYAVDRKKYKTVIGKNVFVGSDSQFIAPVNVGDNAVIGSGSTITKDVPDKALAVARSKQFIKDNYNKGS